MSETRIEPLSHKVPSPRTLGSTFRALTLAGATLTTGLAAGVFYAYAVSVNLSLATQPDASYVATMQAINERIENPLFFASFFGALLLLLATFAVHFPRPRSGRFWRSAASSRSSGETRFSTGTRGSGRRKPCARASRGVLAAPITQPWSVSLRLRAWSGRSMPGC